MITEQHQGKLYLDVTSTLVTRSVTGIPRVVRSLATHGKNSNVILVEFDGLRNTYREVPLRALNLDPATNAPQTTLIQRIYKWAGEIKPLFELITRLLRFRLVFYSMRRTVGPRTKSVQDIVIHTGTLILPEVPLNKAHVRFVEKLSQYETVRLVAFVHDFLPLQYPDLFSSDLVWKYNNYFALLEKTDLCIVSTDEVKKQLQEYFPGKSCAVVPLPASFDINYETSNVELLSFLMVGTIEPRKNHLRVLEAFTYVASRFPNAKLVIVGSRGWEYRKIISTLRRLQNEQLKIEWCENLSDLELLQRYRSASVVLYPSLGEGYGLPIIEALSQGTPVITSDRPVLRDFSKFGGIVLIDPENTAQLSHAMLAFSDQEYRSQLQSQIKRDEIPHSWKQFADAVYQQSVGYQGN